MIHSPLLKYSGLTIILSHPGRFDKNKLIEGYYATEVESALKPFSRHACEIRTANELSDLREGTKVVLLCGAELLPKYFGEAPAKLNQLRGTPKEIGGIVYIPTYHTTDAYDRKEYESRLNKNLNEGEGQEDDEDEDDEGGEKDSEVKGKGRTSRANYGFWLRHDIKKAVRITKSGLLKNTCQYLLRPSLDTITDFMRKCAGCRVFFDIETVPGSDQMSCFALATDPSTVLSVSLINYHRDLTYERQGNAIILRELARLFSTATVVIHNAQFDLFILAHKYKINPPAQDRIEDTMLMHARNYIGVEKSLGHCISLYTDQPYHKDEGIFSPKTFDQETQLLTYNAKDVETLALVYAGIVEHGRNLGTLEAQQQANASIRPYLRCSFRGIKLDNEKLCAHLDGLTERAELFESRVMPKLAGFRLNPRSPKQVASYLYEMLQLPRPKGKVSPTGKTTLYKLAIKYNLPVIKLILYLRRLSKDRGTLSFKQYLDGRATCVYQIAGTKSGRLASKALLGKWGTNLQNLNKDRCREFFIPDPGCVFVQVDQSGAEALIVAMMTKPGSNLRKLLKAGIKAHAYFAMHLFAGIWQDQLFKGSDSHIEAFLQADIMDLPTMPRWKGLAKAIAYSDNNPPSTRYYHHAKMGVHGGNYGIMEGRFCNQVLDKSDGEIVLSLQEGARIIRTLHKVFPEIRADFQASVEMQLKLTGKLKNLYGHPREFYHYGRPLDDTVLREAYSYIPQSTVGILTSLCIADLQARLDSGEYNNFEILANTHDSVLVQCKEEHVEQVKIWIQTHMNRELTSPFGEKFNMKSEATVGKNWKMK